MPSSLASSPVARIPGTSNLNRPTPLELSPLTTPTNNETTPTNSETSVRTSVSSPDLKRPHPLSRPLPAQLVDNLDLVPPSSPVFIISPPVRESLVAPPTSCTPPPSLNKPAVTPPIHIRSKSASSKEPSLDTIHSIDNTPRNSIFEGEVPCATDHTHDHTPHPDTDTGHTHHSGSSPVFMFPSGPNDVIPIQTNEDILLEPPLSFGAEPIITQYTLDTRREETERNQLNQLNQLLFEELMNTPSSSALPTLSTPPTLPSTELSAPPPLTPTHSPSLSAPPPLAPPSPVPSPPPPTHSSLFSEDDHQELIKVLSQHHDGVDDELTPREEVGGADSTHIISIDPPIGFQTSGIEPDVSSSPGRIPLRLKLISPGEFPPPVTDYRRQTTPYTSIEDMPSLFDDILPDTPTTPVCNPLSTPPPSSPVPPSSPPLSPLVTSSISRPSELDDFEESSTSVRRWHSFHGDKNRRVFRSLTDNSMNKIPSSPRKDKKDKVHNKAESASKLGFLRNRSFGKSHTLAARPISLVGLVHSTRDDSDLVDLSDAIEMSKRHKAQTPDYILLPPPEFRAHDDDKTERETDTTSPETSHSSPPLSLSSSSSVARRKFSTGTNEEIVSPLSNVSSNFVTSPEGGRKKNRWSLLRNKTSSGKDEERGQERGGDISPTHSRIHSEPHCTDRINEKSRDQIKDEKSKSLFSVESSDTRRRSKSVKDKRRAGGTTSTSERVELTATVPAGRERRQSRVRNMAREYSKRIKRQTATTESGTTTTRTESGATTTSTESAGEIAPRWVIGLRERRRQANATAANRHSMISQADEEWILNHTTSPLTPTSIHSEMPGFHSPASIESPPMTPDPSWGSAIITPSESFSTEHEVMERPKSTDPKELKSIHSNLQRFSSETVLSQSTEEEDKGRSPSKGGRGQKDGGGRGKGGRSWVRSLVSRFNSNK